MLWDSISERLKDRRQLEKDVRLIHRGKTHLDMSMQHST